jgi:hypothetical protein
MSSASQSDRLPLMDLPPWPNGVNQRHVRRLVAERRIPFVKWGIYSASIPRKSRSDWTGPSQVRGRLGSAGVERRALPGLGHRSTHLPSHLRPSRLGEFHLDHGLLG